MRKHRPPTKRESAAIGRWWSPPRLALAAFALAFWPFPVAAQMPKESVNVDLNTGVPKEVRDVKVDQNLGAMIPGHLELVDSDGTRHSSADYFDGERPVIVTLNYSDCPMLCSVQLTALTQGLKDLDLELGEDFRVLTVSIDPRETVTKAAQTKQRYLEELGQPVGGADGWTFAVADQETITTLTDVLGFRYTYDEATGEYYHAAMLAFVSPAGKIARYSLDVNFPGDQLKMALVEAGEGKVGSPVDQFLLWCYSYDPDKNSYVPQAWRLMRVSAALTVGGMLACLIPYWVGRRRPGRSLREKDPAERTPTSGEPSGHGGSSAGI